MLAATHPVPAAHADHCTCRHCAAEHYVKQLTRADYLQQELSRQSDELAILRRQLALSEYRRLTAETHLAIARNDKAAHARAISERMGCEVSHVEADEIHREYEQEVA